MSATQVQGTTSLTALAKELDRQRETRRDFAPVDTRRIGFFIKEDPTGEFGNDPAITMDDIDGEWELNEYAERQMGQRLGIPSKFWDRMRDDHPDILTDTVTKLFTREPEERMVRTLDGKVRAFLSDRFKPLDNYELMERAVFPALADANLEVKSYGLTDRKMYVKAIFPDVKDDVEVGDTVFGGILISNSEVGAGALEVEPWIYRLICKNGMVVPRAYADFGLRKYHVGGRIADRDPEGLFRESTLSLDAEATFAVAYDVIKGSASGVRFAEIMDAMRKAADTDLPEAHDPPKVVEEIARKNRLDEDEESSIMRHLIAGGDLSAWGYVNAVTRSAQDAESYDRGVTLEELGGKLLGMNQKAWAALAA